MMSWSCLAFVAVWITAMLGSVCISIASTSNYNGIKIAASEVVPRDIANESLATNPTEHAYPADITSQLNDAESTEEDLYVVRKLYGDVEEEEGGNGGFEGENQGLLDDSKDEPENEINLFENEKESEYENEN